MARRFCDNCGDELRGGHGFPSSDGQTLTCRTKCKGREGSITHQLNRALREENPDEAEQREARAFEREGRGRVERGEKVKRCPDRECRWRSPETAVACAKCGTLLESVNKIGSLAPEGGETPKRDAPKMVDRRGSLGGGPRGRGETPSDYLLTEASRPLLEHARGSS